jgi:hypothetical protein
VGFDLEALLGRDSELRRWKRELPSAVVCTLGGELGMVPLTGKLLGELRGRLGNEAARLDADEKHRAYPSASMNEAIRRWCAHASATAPVAHVSTGEFGDVSYERATLWVDGRAVPSGGGLRAVLGYFRDEAGLDLGDRPIDLEIYRGEDAAEKWAAAAIRGGSG